MRKTIKNSVVGWLVFSATVFTTYVAYATISGIWTDPSTMEASTDSVLSSAKWNALLGNVQQLKNSSTAAWSVASIKMLQTRTQATYTTPTSGDGVEMTPLNITVTPKKAGNLVILEWVIHGEVYNDNVFLVKRNGVLLPDATNAANNRWAWITTPDYEADQASTPMTKTIRIADTNSLATTSTYSLHIRSSGPTAYPVTLNMPISSAGTDAYEAWLSSVTATEVYQ